MEFKRLKSIWEHLIYTDKPPLERREYEQFLVCLIIKQLYSVQNRSFHRKSYNHKIYVYIRILIRCISCPFKFVQSCLKIGIESEARKKHPNPKINVLPLWIGMSMFTHSFVIELIYISRKLFISLSKSFKKTWYRTGSAKFFFVWPLQNTWKTSMVFKLILRDKKKSSNNQQTVDIHKNVDVSTRIHGYEICIIPAAVLHVQDILRQ